MQQDMSGIVKVKSVEVSVGDDEKVNDLLAADRGWEILAVQVMQYDLANAVVYVLGKRAKT